MAIAGRHILFDKFIRSISNFNHLNHNSEFDSYLMSVQRSGKAGMATVNEARKDYAETHRSQSRYMIL